MHAVSVTWLELFFDLAAVVATHNVATPVEHDATFKTFASYWLRVILLWSVWHSASMTVNISNARRRVRNVARARGATIEAEQWLGVRARGRACPLSIVRANSLGPTTNNHPHLRPADYGCFSGPKPSRCWPSRDL